MANLTRLLPLLALVVLVSACTQDPAYVEYKGNVFYGREHDDTINGPDHVTYAENSPKYKPGYAHPVEEASVPVVGVTDLPPPGTHGQSSGMNNVSGGSTPFNTPPSQPLAAPSQPIPSAYANAPQNVVSNTAPAVAGSRFIWPLGAGKVILHFGPTSDGGANDGINIAADEGEPIWAAADGVVVYAGDELKGYGNMVILRHADGWMSAYAHERSIVVKKGAAVKQGALIGYVGRSGGVRGPQLHFVLRKDRKPVNPEEFLPGTLPGNSTLG